MEVNAITYDNPTTKQDADSVQIMYQVSTEGGRCGHTYGKESGLFAAGSPRYAPPASSLRSENSNNSL